MKRLITNIITILLLMLVVAPLGAQTLRNVTLTPSDDIMQQPRQRLDKNGQICAIVRVEWPYEGVFFDGNVVGEPWFRGNNYWVYVVPGTRRIDVHVPGHKTLVVNVEDYDIDGFASKTFYDLNFDGNAPEGASATPARPKMESNYVVMKVSPTSAMVQIDGRDVAVESGVVTARLPLGEHTWTARATGYAPASGSFAITASSKTGIDVTLHSTMSTLDIVTSSDVTVTINGKRQGNGNCKVSLLAGIYDVVLECPGHKPYNTTVELREGETTTVSYTDFVPLYGLVDIDYRPVGATVTIDGKSVGETPLSLNDVIVGSHTIVIASPGYTSHTERVTVTETTPSNLRGTLESTTHENARVTATTANPTNTTMQPDKCWSTKPRKFALCAERDGIIYYITEKQWERLSASEQSSFDKKGVYVSGDGNEFLVAIHQVGGNNPEEMIWNEAMRRYGDVLPTKSQAEVMAKNYKAIKAAIYAFGGDKTVWWYWTKTEKDSSLAWIVNMGNGAITINDKTFNSRVRAVAPVPGEIDAEYFDLQGKKVEKPVKGNIYIKRVGETATKVVY